MRMAQTRAIAVERAVSGVPRPFGDRSLAARPNLEFRHARRPARLRAVCSIPLAHLRSFASALGSLLIIRIPWCEPPRSDAPRLPKSPVPRPAPPGTLEALPSPIPRRLSRPRSTLLRAAPAGLPQRAGGAASAGGKAEPPGAPGAGGPGTPQATPPRRIIEPPRALGV